MFLNEFQLQKVLDTVSGKRPADEVLIDMTDFLKTEFSLDILDYICDSTSVAGDVTRQRVQIVVWDMEIKRSSQYALDNDMTIKDRIKCRFSETCKEHHLNKQYYDPQSYFIVITDLKSDVSSFLIESKKETLSSILESYPEVKKYNFGFTEVQVYYEKDSDIEAYRNSGLSQEITSKIQQSLGVISGLEDRNIVGVVFSSIQTFNDKYHGSDYAVFWNGLG